MLGTLLCFPFAAEELHDGLTHDIALSRTQAMDASRMLRVDHHPLVYTTRPPRQILKSCPQYHFAMNGSQPRSLILMKIRIILDCHIPSPHVDILLCYRNAVATFVPQKCKATRRSPASLQIQTMHNILFHDPSNPLAYLQTYKNHSSENQPPPIHIRPTTS